MPAGEVRNVTASIKRDKDWHFVRTKTPTLIEFESRIGSCTCEAILVLNSGHYLAKAQKIKLFETRCLDAVKTASDILEEIL